MTLAKNATAGLAQSELVSRSTSARMDDIERQGYLSLGHDQWWVVMNRDGEPMSNSNDRFVIIGASLAGAKAAEALREEGYAGELTLLGAEEHRPYERPELSKGYLAGATERDRVFVHDTGWYAEHDVELRLG